MTIKGVGIALSLAIAILVAFLDYRFLVLRCGASPSISTIGAWFSALWQGAGVLVVASSFESKASRDAAKFPRLPARQAAYLGMFLLIMGTNFMHEALLRSDAVAVRGSRSSGDACPGPRW
jgi:hypothetical protein